MTLGERATLYEILEITPDASAKEIREAYLRLKSAFSKDSLALYTLIPTRESENILEQIENAYHILSDVDKRREYDGNHGLRRDHFDFGTHAHSQPYPRGKIIPLGSTRSAERHPVQEATEDLLIPPSTDFTQPNAAPPVALHRSSEKTKTHLQLNPPIHHWTPPEGEWSGSQLRALRENRQISIEEISDFTRISKRYIRAIEEENFKEFPARVYLRGFLVQISKYLGAPAELVIDPILQRYDRQKDS